MIVVSDTTPIISLLKINRLNLLHSLYGDVYIPETVFYELVHNRKFQHEAETIINADFIRVMEVYDINSVILLRRAAGLDAGESEAIILSDKIHADLILMDEVIGRQVARQMGLTITGTIGILMTAFEEHLLTAEEIQQSIIELKINGRHISDRLFAQLLDRIRFSEQGTD